LIADDATFESIADPIDVFTAVKLFSAQWLNSVTTDEVLNGILSSMHSTMKALVLEANLDIIFADCAPLDGDLVTEKISRFPRNQRTSSQAVRRQRSSHMVGCRAVRHTAQSGRYSDRYRSVTEVGHRP
jgi:hypothetical protein